MVEQFLANGIFHGAIIPGLADTLEWISNPRDGGSLPVNLAKVGTTFRVTSDGQLNLSLSVR